MPPGGSRIFQSPAFRQVFGILTWVPVAICFNRYGYSAATITGGSMEPTFNPEYSKGGIQQDSVLIERWSVALRQFRRGQVVTLWTPNDPHLLATKRIIALEGDLVQPLEKGSKVVKVPPGHCWVEGDSESHTRDSNSYGPVLGVQIPLALIDSRVAWIVYPLGRIQRVRDSTGKAAERVKTSIHSIHGA